MVGEHLERLGYAAACLGHLDHAEEHRAERLRLACHRLFESRTAANGELDAAQDRPERRPAELALQA